MLSMWRAPVQRENVIVRERVMRSIDECVDAFMLRAALTRAMSRARRRYMPSFAMICPLPSRYAIDYIADTTMPSFFIFSLSAYRLH